MIKSNNLMNCALAMQEGYRRGAFEVIMRNYRGELAECSVSNLFIVKNGVALTPPLSAGSAEAATTWDSRMSAMGELSHVGNRVSASP